MLPQEDVLGINGSVVMVVAKQPVVVLDPVFDLLEEVRQVVRTLCRESWRAMLVGAQWVRM